MLNLSTAFLCGIPQVWSALLVLAASGAVASARAQSPAGVATITTNPEAVAKARADSIRRPYTDADVHFMSGMIGHHEQAILMAGWVADRSAGPAVRTLAERIINAQQDEIAIMRQWLADRDKPLADHVHMPGMLTVAQLEQLEHAHGPDFDRRFLTLMIRHHEGAVAAVDALLATHGAAQDQTVFKIASDIHVDQTTEIARMKQMLTRFITD